ncbi:MULTISPECIES: ABC transporter permease [Pseudomonas]|jgi:putative ABC transport system permease protein|uniref:ABC transporter permease n=1 Tax=Pseudomonas TaxID=286 RepID=UPI001A9FC7FB|nr:MULTISPECIES: ABC transporter permease [Pseudomonas]MCM8912463.1 ABC transporter permease [Pseudomonas inefficax]
MSEAYGPSWPQRIGEALGSVRQSGARAVLALLGIAVGCAALVALMNIGHSAAQHTRQLFQGLGSELLIANLEATVERGEPMALEPVDLPPGIRAAAPLAVSVATVRFNGESIETMVVGSTTYLNEVLRLQVDQGRLLSGYDELATHVLLGASLARQLRVSSGDRLQLGSYGFDVVGVLAPHGYNPMLPVNFDDAVLMPLSGVRRLNPPPDVGTLVALGVDAMSLPQAARSLYQYLQSRLPRHEVNVQLPRQMLESMAGQSRMMTWMLASTAAIALLLGGVGVMNVMVMNVVQRRREIGVRMALGARGCDIAWLFVLEALLLSVAGALLGVLLGLAGAWLFTLASGWSFALDAGSLPVSMGISLVLGLFFGLQPALAAARLQPVVALRDD